MGLGEGESTGSWSGRSGVVLLQSGVGGGDGFFDRAGEVVEIGMGIRAGVEVLLEGFLSELWGGCGFRRGGTTG